MDVPAIASREDLTALGERFHEAHLRRYGHKATSEVIEIVNYKVTGVGVIPKPELTPLPETAGPLPEPLETRRAFFGPAGFFETPVYRRSDLAPGARLVGPAIVQEQTSTIVLYPGQNGKVDGYLNIEIDVGQA